MAKSKSRNSRSSKTAHVLNLLTDTSEKNVNEDIPENPGQDTAETAVVASSMESPSIPSAAPVHRAVDQEVELQIRSALEEALLEDISSSEANVLKPHDVPGSEPLDIPEPEPQPEPVDVTAPEPEPVEVTAPEPENQPEAVEVTVPEPETQPEAVEVTVPEPENQPEAVEVTTPEPENQPEAVEVTAPEPETQPEPVDIPTPEQEVKEEEFLCLNVMQTIVEDMAAKYIKMFGLCDCPRCRIDVVALTLTNLPAKYVVVTKQDRIPMLSFYEGHYSAEIISQVMNACKRVMEHPRHHKPKTDG